MRISTTAGTIEERTVVGLIVLILVALGALGLACASAGGGNGAQRSDDEASDVDAARRSLMVKAQIRARGIHDDAVLDAMRAVPRHRFVPDSMHRWHQAEGEV